MKKLVVGTFLTLDGVMQAPGDPQEDTEGGFDRGGWQMPFFDADAGQIMDKQMAETDGMVLGRKTYEIFARYWPNAGQDDPMARRMNEMPKYVASRTLQSLDWNNARLMRGDLADEISKAKQESGSGVLSVVGSGRLAQSLMKEDLVDEYVLWIHPIVLGQGKRLFENGVVPINLKLVDAKTTGSGIQILTYRPEAKE